MNTALTIAGSDSSGGAGIQADLKTMAMHGVFGMSAIAALTAQNTLGVRSVLEVSPEFLAEQLDCIFTDIFPDAVKIGMLSSSALMETTAEQLRYYHARHIVLDPVMVATSGSRLMNEDASETLTRCLFPLAELITPNIPEAEALAEMAIRTAGDMERAASRLYSRWGCAVLLKGGHSVEDANDLLYSDRGAVWIRGERISNPNTHGTGCTLSSAIASNLALGHSLEDSVRRAKSYLTGALAAGLDLGRGCGPLNHSYLLEH